MPHLYIEYTDNLDIDINRLLSVSQKALLEFPDIIPVGGLRIRAVKHTDYIIADGQANDGFVHLILKLGAGRTETVKVEITQHLFDAVSNALDEVFESQSIALSLELHEFTHPTLKRNNIHERFKK